MMTDENRFPVTIADLIAWGHRPGPAFPGLLARANTARAEGLGMTCNVGIAERADRLLAVLLATGLVGLNLPRWVLTAVLALLVVASAVTVVQRMATVHRQARAMTQTTTS